MTERDSGYRPQESALNNVVEREHTYPAHYYDLLKFLSVVFDKYYSPSPDFSVSLSDDQTLDGTPLPKGKMNVVLKGKESELNDLDSIASTLNSNATDFALNSGVNHIINDEIDSVYISDPRKQISASPKVGSFKNLVKLLRGKDLKK